MNDSAEAMFDKLIGEGESTNTTTTTTTAAPPHQEDDEKKDPMSKTRGMVRQLLAEVLASLLYGFFTRLAYEFSLSVIVLGAAVGASVFVVMMAMPQLCTLSIEYYLLELLATKRQERLFSPRVLLTLLLVMISQYLGALTGSAMAHSIGNKVYATIHTGSIQIPIGAMHERLGEGVLEHLSGSILLFTTMISLVEFLMVLMQQPLQSSQQLAIAAQHRALKIVAGRAFTQALAVWTIFPYFRFFIFSQWLAELTLFDRRGATSVMANTLGKIIAFIVAFGTHRLYTHV